MTVHTKRDVINTYVKCVVSISQLLSEFLLCATYISIVYPYMKYRQFNNSGQPFVPSFRP